MRWSSLLLGLVLLAGVKTVAAQEQGQNADLVKMIGAGLPESTILNKIHEGAGHWDTSVDALIALKREGATEEELNALTAGRPAQAVLASSAPSSTIVFGGYVENHGGDVSYFFPGAGVPSQMRFHLVLVDGLPALRMYTEACCDGRHEVFGDLLLTRDKAIFSIYGIRTVDDEVVERPKPMESHEYPMKGLELKAGYGRLDYYLKNDLDDGGRKRLNIPLSLMDVKNDDDVPSVAFLRLLLRDFDHTMAALLSAAAISEPSSQIVPAARFGLAKEQPLSLRLEQATDELRFNVAEALRAEAAWKSSHQSDGGSGLLSAVNAIKGVTSMAQAVQQGNIAAANHDTVGAFNAGLAMNRAEMSVLTGTPSALPDTGSTAAPNIQASASEQVANIQAQAQQAQAEAAQRQAEAAQQASDRIRAQEEATERVAAEAAVVAPPPPPPPPANACEIVRGGISVESRWFSPAFNQNDPSNHEVVWFFSNASSSTVTCRVAYWKQGQWVDDQGDGVFRAGTVRAGGQGDGGWQMDANSSDIRYVCYAGDEPSGARGLCTNSTNWGNEAPDAGSMR